MSITISSGHGKYVNGASDIVNEVTEARRITEAIAKALRSSMTVNVHHDDVSRDQDTNVNSIVATHNKTSRDADYSIHLNASTGRQQGDIGVEVLYYSDSAKSHAQALADAISAATGLKNRGAIKRTNLGFLKRTNKPAFLIEAYFVNSVADVAKMKTDEQVAKFAEAVAKTICANQGVAYKGGVEPVPTKSTEDTNTPSPVHAASWEWAQSKGFIDGTRPKDPLTREQFTTVLQRLYNDIYRK